MGTTSRNGGDLIRKKDVNGGITIGKKNNGNYIQIWWCLMGEKQAKGGVSIGKKKII